MKKTTSIRFIVLVTLLMVFSFVNIFTLYFNAENQSERLEEFAKHQVSSMASSYFDTLNTMMLSGSIANREVYRNKLLASENIVGARVVRGELITSMFGKGLGDEQPLDSFDRQALKGEMIEIINDTDKGRVLTVIKPVKAEANTQGLNCHSCHQSEEGDVLGAIRIDYSLAQEDSELLQGLITNAVVQFALFFIGFLITAWILNHLVVSRLQRLHDGMMSIADNSDLRIELEVMREDEIGFVSQAFNRMILQINNSLCQVVDHAQTVNQAARSITDMTETTGRQVSDQKNHTDQVATAMTEMAASAVQVQNNAVETTAQSQQTTRAAISGEQQAQTAVKGIQALNAEVQAGAARIQQLHQRTDEVASILEVISNIADQTNLLALNAAIEAARAGDQGRGFAVVADEVRTLAFRTQESTGEIRQTIDALKTEATDCVKIMDNASILASEQMTSILAVAHDLDGIAAAVRSISDLNVQMESAAKEQSQVAESINSSIVEITDLASSTEVDASQTARIAEDMLAISDELQRVVELFKLRS